MKIAFIEVVAENKLAEETYAPNLFYAIAKRDLSKAGYECDILRIKREELFFRDDIKDVFIRYLSAKNYGLIGLSKSFNPIMLELIYYIRKTLPSAKIVIGGVNAFTDMHKDCDYLVQGAGRNAILQLIRFLSGEVPISSVPNLFYKKDGLIYHTENIEKTDINRELIDFQPDYGCINFGSMRGKPIWAANIVGCFGCCYGKTIKDNKHFRDIDFSESDENLQESARRVMISYTARVGHGCSFCNICVDREYTTFPKHEIVSKLISQLKYITSNYPSIKYINLTDEYPYNYLYNLIKEIIRQEIPINRISLGGRADWFSQNIKAIRETIKLLESTNIKIVFEAIGFENFSQRELDLFNKGISVSTNNLVVKELYDLKRTFPHSFDYNMDLLILFNPWTRIQDIEINVKALLKLGEKYKANNFRCLNKMRIFPFTPLFYKARKDGLLTEPNDPSITPCKWRFEDERVEDIMNQYYDYVFKILSEKRGSIDYNKEQIIFLQELVSAAKKKKSGRTKINKGYFTLKVGLKCNNDCVYCDHLGYKAEKDYTTKELKSFINKARKEGYRKIRFPCNSEIRTDFFHLIDYARKRDLKVSLITNGRLFSIEHNIDVLLQLKVNHIGIYLNANRQELHDILTHAPGSFEQTMKGIRNLDKISKYEKSNHRRSSWSIFTALTCRNYYDLSELNDLINSFSCNDWIIQCVPKKEDDTHKTMFNIKKYGTIADTIKKLPQSDELI
jgi:hypothetical protein